MNRKRIFPLKVSVITLGCKVNQYDSEVIKADLGKTGWGYAESDEVADMYIINTCTVTHKAAMQSRQAIRKAVRENPDAVIVATGCYAQSEPDTIAKIRGIDCVIGNSDKHRIPEIIGYEKKPVPGPPLIIKNNIKNSIRFNTPRLPVAFARTRPYIKIQDGCDHFCTYCIVPYTRGPSRSLPPEVAINQIRYHAKQGAHEVVLTGIHLGRYGMDLSPSTSLIDLFSLIHQENLIDRVRLSSIEPMELTDEILNFTKDSGRICPHFHIPLQSGDKTVLKRMHRPYDPDQCRRLVEKIHCLLPDAGIGIDVMVGFPGETDDAFENTYALIKSLPITYLHIFPFSPRPPAAASRYPNQIAAGVVRERRNRLFDLGQAKKRAFYQRMIGKTLDVLIETKRDKKRGLLKGVSANYVKVLADGDDCHKNKIIPCRIEKISPPEAVVGKIIG